MASSLLDHGAQVNTALGDGMTPLMMVVKAEDINLVCLLIANNANAHAANQVGVTALHIACAEGNLKTVRALIHYGADANPRCQDYLRS